LSRKRANELLGDSRFAPAKGILFSRVMTLVERLIELWTRPLPAPAEALAAFRDAYNDPVSVNGVEIAVAELVGRAAAIQRAFADLRIELIEQVEAPGRSVIVFWQRGRHVGPLETPLGVVEATGRDVQIRVIDVLSISDGRISAIQVVPDNLALGMQLDAFRLA
jgi:SnoaL-like polyketide cyclase